MNNNNNQTEHAYQLIRSWLSRLVLLYFPVVGISFLVFSLLTFLPFLRTSIEDSLLTTCVGLIVFICTIYMYRVLTQARIVVTEDGITYYGWGYCMYTPWKNIIGLTGFRPYQFTILHTRTISGFQLSQNYRSDLELAEGRLQGIAVLKTTWWNPTWSMAPFANKFPLVDSTSSKQWGRKSHLFFITLGLWSWISAFAVFTLFLQPSHYAISFFEYALYSLCNGGLYYGSTWWLCWQLVRKEREEAGFWIRRLILLFSGLEIFFGVMILTLDPQSALIPYRQNAWFVSILSVLGIGFILTFTQFFVLRGQGYRRQ